MNFMKRAILSLTRRKSKTLILFIVVFVLGNVMAFGIAIRQATGKINDNMRQSLTGRVVIEIDYDKLYEDVNAGIISTNADVPVLDNSLMEQIGDLSYVKYYDYNHSNSLVPKNINTYEYEEISAYFDNFIYLKGTQYPAIFDFEEGITNLIQGRTFTEEEIQNGDYVIIIPEELADLNNLNIGDSIALGNDVNSIDGNSILFSNELVFEVIGIYEYNDKSIFEDDADIMSQYTQQVARNTGYAPNKIAFEETELWWEKAIELLPDFYKEENKALFPIPVYVLNDANDLDTFIQEVEPLIPDYYMLNYASDNYSDIEGSVNQMLNMSQMILIGAVVATVIILSLVIVLFLKDRKHEFGIYLALGETKAKLLGQIMIEILVVAFIAISLSLFSGNIVAKNLSSNMLQSELEKAAKDDSLTSGIHTTLDAGYYFGSTDQNEVLDAYEIKFDSNYIIMIYAIGLGTSLISTVIPMVYTTRLKPKKILM